MLLIDDGSSPWSAGAPLPLAALALCPLAAQLAVDHARTLRDIEGPLGIYDERIVAQAAAGELWAASPVAVL